MKKIMIVSVGVVFAAALFFKAPVQSQPGNGYYKLKNCLAIGEKKCTNSGSDCAFASGCAAPPLN